MLEHLFKQVGIKFNRHLLAAQMPKHRIKGGSWTRLAATHLIHVKMFIWWFQKALAVRICEMTYVVTAILTITSFDVYKTLLNIIVFRSG